jgi:hypothetical protein
LDYTALKRRVVTAGDGGPIAPGSSHPTLIELGPAPGGASSCVIEIESACGGRLRVQMAQVTVADLVALSRGVWEGGSTPR